MQTKQEFIDNQIAGLNAILNILYVLLALSVIVSLFGIVNTLVLTVFERTRELGMLRAIGMTRRQVRRMIRHESVITALIGGTIGIALGIVLGALLVARVDFIVFALPVGQLIVFAIATIVRRHRRRDLPGAARGAAERARSAPVRVTARRDELAALLAAHEPADDEEARDLETMRGYAGTLGDPFSRDEPEAHFTGSAVVVDDDGARTLLVHHAKSGAWFQPGGHIEPDDATLGEAALREAREETGLDVRLHDARPARRRRALDPVGRALPPRPALPRRRLRHARARRRRGARGGVADVGRGVRADRRAGAPARAREGPGRRQALDAARGSRTAPGSGASGLVSRPVARLGRVVAAGRHVVRPVGARRARRGAGSGRGRR